MKLTILAALGMLLISPGLCVGQHDQARVMYAEGMKAYRDGNYPASVAPLTSSYEAWEHAQTAYMLALVHALLDESVGAAKYAERALRGTPRLSANLVAGARKILIWALARQTNQDQYHVRFIMSELGPRSRDMLRVRAQEEADSLRWQELEQVGVGRLDVLAEAAFQAGYSRCDVEPFRLNCLFEPPTPPAPEVPLAPDHLL